MGNANSTACHSSHRMVEANPDVAGIGVLVSFVASTMLVLLAVVYGYIRDSLPESTLTRLDYYLLSDLPKGLVSTLDSLEKSKDGLNAWLKRVAPGIFGPYAAPVELDAEQVLVRKRRKDSLEGFILSLSDQQLVTGLAILIAGFSQMYSMSAHHFNIVASLAWFSSATHLATLAILKNYFREHTTVRNWRVGIMLILLIMLVVAQVPGWADKDNSVPVICYYQDLHRRDMLTVSTAIGFLLITYTEGIARLYTRDIDWNLPDRCIERIVQLLSPFFFTVRYRRPLYLKKTEESQFPGGNSSRRSVNTIRAEREKGRFDRFESNVKGSRRLIGRYALATVFMGRELAFSFFITMALLITDITYGFVQVFEYRAAAPLGGIKGNQNEISFGQLVPLLLLLLPIFTMMEIHSEDHSTANLLARKDPKVSQKAFDAAKYSTSLKTFLDSLTFVTNPLSESRSRGSIDLEGIEFDPPERVWTGNHSREAQKSEVERLVHSSTAGYDPQTNKDGRIGTAWPAPSFSTNFYEIPSSQQLRRASSRPSDLADDPDDRYHTKIHYKSILWCVIAVQFPYEIMVALAVAGVFGSHKSSTASFFLYSFGVAAFFGIAIGVWQRMKEIKRQSRMAS